MEDEELALSIHDLRFTAFRPFTIHHLPFTKLWNLSPALSVGRPYRLRKPPELP